MIETILEIRLHILPMFTHSFIKTEENTLIKYAKILNELKFRFSYYFKDLMLMKYQEKDLGIEVFAKKFRDPGVKMLLHHDLLRNFIIKEYETTKDNKSTVNFEVEETMNPLTIDLIR